MAVHQKGVALTPGAMPAVKEESVLRNFNRLLPPYYRDQGLNHLLKVFSSMRFCFGLQKSSEISSAFKWTLYILHHFLILNLMTLHVGKTQDVLKCIKDIFISSKTQ